MSEERSLRAQGPLPLPATSHTHVGVSPRSLRAQGPLPLSREIESVR